MAVVELHAGEGHKFRSGDGLRGTRDSWEPAGPFSARGPRGGKEGGIQLGLCCCDRSTPTGPEPEHTNTCTGNKKEKRKKVKDFPWGTPLNRWSNVKLSVDSNSPLLRRTFSRLL